MTFISEDTLSASIDMDMRGRGVGEGGRLARAGDGWCGGKVWAVGSAMVWMRR